MIVQLLFHSDAPRTHIYKHISHRRVSLQNYPRSVGVCGKRNRLGMKESEREAGISIGTLEEV